MTPDKQSPQGESMSGLPRVRLTTNEQRRVAACEALREALQRVLGAAGAVLTLADIEEIVTDAIDQMRADACTEVGDA